MGGRKSDKYMDKAVQLVRIARSRREPQEAFARGRASPAAPAQLRPARRAGAHRRLHAPRGVRAGAGGLRARPDGRPEHPQARPAAARPRRARRARQASQACRKARRQEARHQDQDRPPCRQALAVGPGRRDRGAEGREHAEAIGGAQGGHERPRRGAAGRRPHAQRQGEGDRRRDEREARAVARLAPLAGRHPHRRRARQGGRVAAAAGPEAADAEGALEGARRARPAAAAQRPGGWLTQAPHGGRGVAQGHRPGRPRRHAREAAAADSGGQGGLPGAAHQAEEVVRGPARRVALPLAAVAVVPRLRAAAQGRRFHRAEARQPVVHPAVEAAAHGQLRRDAPQDHERGREVGLARERARQPGARSVRQPRGHQRAARLRLALGQLRRRGGCAAHDLRLDGHERRRAQDLHRVDHGPPAPEGLLRL
eukprot:2144161-Prymnesium_polylepis.2